jgi:hypothetical protein
MPTPTVLYPLLRAVSDLWPNLQDPTEQVGHLPLLPEDEGRAVLRNVIFLGFKDLCWFLRKQTANKAQSNESGNRC